MKKIILASVLATVAVASIGTANAATANVVCNAASPAANGTFATDTSVTTEFVKVAFTPKCSANVHMHSTQNPNSIGVASGSTKGKNLFGGGSNSGGVVNKGTCPTGGCTATEAGGTNSAAYMILS
jgi:hypothetical protein